ncbi:pyridoxamine 5'-phosphate oxidase family protein [Anaerotalea alkaliphila]|uniref:Pyridoxamine 5'-phosphate oxidase family protein n=1 Tax=Anaerotalea alkaliphila TaxID=2662126 RepID=A0A7X5KM78_9FIRM|nr:pyridoxamine 5'-phosphate oxidase family protein [Anaerotalea alkaliphila]NDL67519.1 pyridoxamine 5'-phosphate oxidase family protein [Anaerotalea alkaliphila]
MGDIESMVRNHSLCVLCTEGGGKPYASLMTYLPGDAPWVLYMVATRNSRKYRNLLENPNVSVLIDTRQDVAEAPGGDIQSATMEGTFKATETEEERKLKERFAVSHPELGDILQESGCVVFQVRLDSYLLLRGPVHQERGSFP